jgi:hypothetical protein
MAITLSTTLAVACGKDDRTIKLTSGTSAAVGMVVKMEQEFSSVAAIASDGVTITLGVRGAQGSAVVAHKILAPVEVSTASDFFNSPIGSDIPIPYSTKELYTYGAAGAIQVPSEDANIFLVAGTAAAMTLPLPTTDIDGVTLTISAGAAQAYTVTVPTATGYKNTTGTATYAAAIGNNMVIVAYKGQWLPVSVIGVTFA